jgi:hypothetical protein
MASFGTRNKQRLLAFGLLAYVVTVGAILLVWNAQAGGLVQGWYEEYVGPDGQVSGSGKWRSEEGQSFHAVALLFGTWVYPVSIVATGLLLKLAAETSCLRRKLLSAGGAGLALYVLYRFMSLGLFRAVSSL